MRLLLVRHAQIPSNVLGVLDTARPGPSLTELGRTQAVALSGTLADEPIDAVFASTLIRTQETIAPTAEQRGLEPRLLEGLREIRAGDLEGERTREAQRAYMETVFRWANGERDVAMPGGETGEEFFARFDAALAEVAESGAADAVVVSHGAAIRCWSATVAGADRDFLATHPLPNTGIVALEGEPGGWRMREWREHPAGQPVLVPSGTDDPAGSGG
ncbi:histidine phosphatase family protein [Amnibacterium sp. CER49]|uniref:histidine phosphatase family protein n=1 Tax=Amnibacterium sp. CER49 TaxID=3039161 RepID=UPI002447365F|nr:histidine phosphatase family protein [Amnibacterium sp. CER49]MDH2444264.1 histidine phosphatase family protein [Amnibacterium sp. CER49]